MKRQSILFILLLLLTLFTCIGCSGSESASPQTAAALPEEASAGAASSTAVSLAAAARGWADFSELPQPIHINKT